MTIKEILKNNNDLSYKIPFFEQGILLSSAINKRKEYILSYPEKRLTKLQISKFNKFISRRLSGEPIAYIIGKKEFYSLDFFVNKNVLIPRSETELLVDLSIEKINSFFFRNANNKMTLIDVGTGSGNIIISIAKNIPKKIRDKINFYAVDISENALRIAKINAKKHKIDRCIKFLQSDLLRYFLEGRKEKKIISQNFFIVANLPYVSHSLYKKNKNNLKFEPKIALVSNYKGLNHQRKLIREIKGLGEKYRSFRVFSCLELSPEQKPKISQISKQYLPSANIEFLKDLAGKWRVAVIEI